MNNDGKGGSAPDPLVGSRGALAKKTRIDSLSGTLPGFLVLLHFGQEDGEARRTSSSSHDVADWPCSVSLLVEMCAFLETLH